MKIIGCRELTFRYSRGRVIGDANGVFPRDEPFGRLLFVESDVGVTGVSMALARGVGSIFPLVEGEDPRSVVGIWQKLERHFFKKGLHGQDYLAAVALDAALWDLKAKLAGEPLWRLLGAREPRVKLYASGLCIGLSDEELAEFYGRFAALGIDAGKLKVGVDLASDLRRLGIMRDVLAKPNREPALIIDANEYWGAKQAAGYIARFEERSPLSWVEEPIRRKDYRGFQRLSQVVRSPLATGENLEGVADYMPLIEYAGVDVVQFGKNRAVTIPMRLAQIADAHQLSVSYNHSWGGHLAHALAAMPNANMMELQDLESPPGIEIDSRIEDGYLIPGDSPGWGMQVDETKLKIVPASEEPRKGGQGPHIRREGAGCYVVPPRAGEGYYGEGK